MKPGDLWLHLEAYLALKKALGFPLGVRERLLRELRDLERRRGTAGRDRSITHPEDMTIVPTLWLAHP